MLLRAVECATVHAARTSIAEDLRWKAPCGGAVQRSGAVTPVVRDSCKSHCGVGCAGAPPEQLGRADLGT
eukprot:9625108-Alexandrium_andersonii.AAC.1